MTAIGTSGDKQKIAPYTIRMDSWPELHEKVEEALALTNESRADFCRRAIEERAERVLERMPLDADADVVATATRMPPDAARQSAEYRLLEERLGGKEEVIVQLRAENAHLWGEVILYREKVVRIAERLALPPPTSSMTAAEAEEVTVAETEKESGKARREEKKKKRRFLQWWHRDGDDL